jgi:hypothetical protein
MNPNAIIFRMASRMNIIVHTKSKILTMLIVLWSGSLIGDSINKKIMFRKITIEIV